MKFKTVLRDITTDVTINGRTSTVPDTVEERVPVAPRMWGDVIRRACVGTAIAFTACSVIWGMVAAAGLLSKAAPVWVAFLAAAVFDGAWVLALALQWDARLDPRRAAVPRKFGIFAVVVSMAVITTHGVVFSSWTVGIVGAAVTLVAKTAWEMVLHHFSPKLSTPVRGWIADQTAQAQARLAVVTTEMQVARADQTVRDYRTALGLDPAPSSGAQIEMTRTGVQSISAPVQPERPRFSPSRPRFSRRRPRFSPSRPRFSRRRPRFSPSRPRFRLEPTCSSGSPRRIRSPLSPTWSARVSR